MQRYNMQHGYREKARAMARKDKFDYFQAFEKISDFAVKYSDELTAFLETHYDAEKEIGHVESSEVLRVLSDLHAIEEESDHVAHDIIEHLSTEFIAPIEREDILALADELDNVVDDLDDVLQRMYMYDITIITPEVMEMAQIVHKSTITLQAACQKFTHFKKSKSIKRYIVEINTCEDEGDKLYIKSVHQINHRARLGAFEHPLDSMGVCGVLSALEKCCDACEAAGDIMMTVRLKNS